MNQQPEALGFTQLNGAPTTGHLKDKSPLAKFLDGLTAIMCQLDEALEGNNSHDA